MDGTWKDIRKVFAPLFAVVPAACLAACMAVPIPVGKGVPLQADLDGEGRIRIFYVDEEDDLCFGTLDGFEFMPEKVPFDIGMDSMWGVWGYPGFSMALDPEGHPHIAYFEEKGEDQGVPVYSLVHAWRNAEGWRSETIEGAEGAYFDVFFGMPVRPPVAIAIDDAGAVHLAYFEMEESGPPWCMGFRYGVRRDGAWNFEPLTVLSPCVSTTSGYEWGQIRLALSPEGNPVIAAGVGGSPLGRGWRDMGGAFISVHVAEKTEGGGWQTERIYYDEVYDPYYDNSVMYLLGMSLVVSSSGERAVGFVGGQNSKVSQDEYYWVMTQGGGDWTMHQVTGSGCSHCCEEPCVTLGTQDLKFDAEGSLHAVIVHHGYSYPGNEPVDYMVYAVREGADWTSGWEWVPNEIFPAWLSSPVLAVGDSPEPSILCSGRLFVAENPAYMCVMSPWRDLEKAP